MQFCVWHVRNIKPLMKYLMMYSEHLMDFAVSKCFCFLDHEEEQYAGFIIQQEEYVKALLYET